MNKHIILNPKKKFGADPSIFEKNAKLRTSTHFNSEKMTSPSRRLGYSINQLNCYHLIKIVILKIFFYSFLSI